MLTVKMLRNALEKLPDDMPVLVNGVDGGCDHATLYDPMEFRRTHEAPGGFMGEFGAVQDNWGRDEEDWLGAPFSALVLGRY